MCKYLFDLQIYLCKYEYYLFYSYLRKYYLFTALSPYSSMALRFVVEVSYEICKSMACDPLTPQEITLSLIWKFRAT